MKNQQNLRDIKVLAFDADDTLWDNQSYYDNAEEVLMIGNSFKSDIAPVLRIGGYGIHIPFERTWQHEIIEEFEHDRLIRIENFREILHCLK